MIQRILRTFLNGGSLADMNSGPESQNQVELAIDSYASTLAQIFGEESIYSTDGVVKACVRNDLLEIIEGGGHNLSEGKLHEEWLKIAGRHVEEMLGEPEGLRTRSRDFFADSTLKSSSFSDWSRRNN